MSIYLLIVAAATTPTYSQSLPYAIVPSRPPRADAGKAVGPVPTGNPGAWVTTDDYPEKAWADNVEGLVRFTLNINTEGRVTACAITDSSGSPELDAATCSNVTQRAVFSPARDAQGRDVAGQYSNQVRWQIPDSADSPPPFENPFKNPFEYSGNVTVNLDYNKEGVVANCEVEREGTLPIPDDFIDGLCERVNESDNTKPFLSPDGKPQARRVIFKFSMENEKVPAKQ